MEPKPAQNRSAFFQTGKGKETRPNVSGVLHFYQISITTHFCSMHQSQHHSHLLLDEIATRV